MIVIVRFNHVEEFLEEIARDAAIVDRSILRVTNLYTPLILTPNIKRVSVLATARVGNEIVRLETYCGDIWGLGKSDADVLARATQIVSHVTERAEQLDLQVRAGVFDALEPTPA